MRTFAHYLTPIELFTGALTLVYFARALTLHAKPFHIDDQSFGKKDDEYI
jgi:hypothetical protein